MKKQDIENAKNKIDEMFKLRDQLIQSSNFLADIKSRLQFYEKAIDEIPEKADNFLSLIETPITSILSLSPTNLDFSSVTGVTGSFYAVSGDTKQIITDYGSMHYNLIVEYNNIKKTDELIDEVLKIILDFRHELQTFQPYQLLLDAKEAYSKWKTKAIDNSDLAKEIRAFQDVFKGCLNTVWQTTGNLKSSEFKWNKMAEVLGKNSGGCKNSLKQNKANEDKYHSEFSEILKKTKTVTEEEMEELFTGYIELLYSNLNLLNLSNFE